MGNDEFGLKSLGDDQLLAGLAGIVGRRNQITAVFLAYLAELDERQLFLDLGFSSLFEYCVVNLKLCESTAGRHIAAARVCRNHPEAFAMVASGMLHASALSLLKKHVTTENAAELFELCSHQSARKVEELLAARFPRPDVRDLVRRLPTRAAFTPDVGCWAEQVPLAASSSEPAALDGTPTESMLSLLHARAAEASVLPASRAASVDPKLAEVAKSRRFEPLAADRFGVHFTADGEFCALLERVRGLAGHRLPSGDLMTLLRRGLEAYERELEKERFAVGRKSRRSRDDAPASACAAPEVPKSDVSEPASSGPKPKPSESVPSELVPSEPVPSEPVPSEPVPSEPVPSEPGSPAQPPTSEPRPTWKRRHCSAEVVRAVFLRDGRQCSYVASDGRRCGARRCLELDHIEPLAVGGEATIENLRLRCRAHNQWYARQYFGAARVKAAVQGSRRRRRRAVQMCRHQRDRALSASDQQPPGERT